MGAKEKKRVKGISANGKAADKNDVDKNAVHETAVSSEAAKENSSASSMIYPKPSLVADQLPDFALSAGPETGHADRIQHILNCIKEVETSPDLANLAQEYKNKILSMSYFDLGFQISLEDTSSNAFLEYYNNLEKAVELNPENSRGYHHLAFCYRVFGRKDAEVAALKKVIELEPDNIDSRCVLHDLYTIMGNTRAAARVFSRDLMKKYKEFGLTHTKASLEELLQKNPAKFEKLYEESKLEVAKASTRASYYYNLSLMQKLLVEKKSQNIQNHSEEDHSRLLASAYRLNPYLKENMQDKIFSIDDLSKVCKRPSKARRLLKALFLTGYHPALHYLLGEYFASKGDYDLAKKHMGIAVKHAPKHKPWYSSAIDSIFAFMVEKGRRRSVVRSFAYLLNGLSSAVKEKVANLQDQLAISDEEISRYGYEMIISRNDFATLHKIKDSDTRRALFPHLIDTPFILEVLIDMSGIEINYDKRIALHLAALLHDIERLEENPIKKRSYGLGDATQWEWQSVYRKKDIFKRVEADLPKKTGLYRKGVLPRDKPISYNEWSQLYYPEQSLPENSLLRRDLREILYCIYKEEHSKKSAEICSKLLKNNCPDLIISLATSFVEQHEFGGGLADFVMAADSISFMNCVSKDYILKRISEGKLEDAEFKVSSFMFSRLYTIDYASLKKTAMYIIKPFYTLAEYRLAEAYLNKAEAIAADLEKLQNDKTIQLREDEKSLITRDINSMLRKAQEIFHMTKVMKFAFCLQSEEEEFKSKWPMHTQQGKYLKKAYGAAQGKSERMEKKLDEGMELFQQKYSGSGLVL